MLLGEEPRCRPQVGGAEAHGLNIGLCARGDHAGAEQDAGKDSGNEKAAAKGISLAHLKHVRLAPLAISAGRSGPVASI